MLRRLQIALLLLAGMLWLPASAVSQEQPPGVTIYVVQRGENLYRIALRYGITVEELAALNSLTNPGSLQVGQRLLVPDKNAFASDIPEAHIIQPGETLRSIADLYGLSVEMLAAQNNIADPNAIYVGQVITLIPLALPDPTVAPPPALSASVSNIVNQIHTVQSGETLFRIATSYGLTVNDIARINNISDPTVIYAGQQLVIPGIEAPQLALDLPPTVERLEVLPLVLVEGKTGRVRIVTKLPMSISGVFLNRNIHASSEPGGLIHHILVGVPIFTEPGIYPFQLALVESIGTQTDLLFNVQVVAGNYGSEYISLLADRSNLLDPNVENSELGVVNGFMSVFTPTRYWQGVMGLPAAASVISPFGRRRSFNGGPFDHFHSGTDFGGAAGTPIMAAAPGYVVFTDVLNIRGRATIIDHGWGVFTGYWHQSEQYVQVGDSVTAGQVIGLIGSTGRVSGAHLHWELWVNGVPVDPMQWVQQSFL